MVSNYKANLRLWRHILETEESWQIHQAETAELALKFLKNYQVDAVISDIDIEPFDGWRLARLVRSGTLSTGADVPIILVAGIYCERLAETTARFYDVNYVIPSEQVQQLKSLLLSFNQVGNIMSSLPQLLVVADKADTGVSIARILGNQFYVSITNQLDEALALFKQSNFDIVLIDHKFKHFSAKELLTQIVQINPEQSVVVMTTPGNLERAEALMMLGAVDFIRKPFKAVRLRKVCELAARRQDFMLSNQQFAEKVAALKISEEEHRLLSQAHQQLLNHLSTIIIELDEFGVITYVNKSWQSLTGYYPSETIGENLLAFIGNNVNEGENTKSMAAQLSKVLSREVDKASIECKIIGRQHAEVWVDAKLSRLVKHDGSIGCTISMDNITERREAELKLQHIALHDPLTGLHNRHFFDQALCKTSAAVSLSNSTHVLLYIDLDHFKIINDTEGHHVGDVVLKDVATTLEQSIRSSDILCRIGGDEFAIILLDTLEEQAIEVANTLCGKVRNKHFQFGENEYKISCSMGMTLIDGTEPVSHEYLKHADIALYVAKKRGRNMVHRYNQSDRDSENFRNNLKWVRKVQEALAKDSLVLHFQPIIDIQNEKVAYFEALVRLQSDGRLIYPNQFIPALEKTTDINGMDHTVVTKAISMLAKYPSLHRVAVNLSAHAFSNEQLLPLIEKQLTKNGVSAKRLIFEITESASLSNLPATKCLINKIRALGCAFSIDDFGTGFSTFTYLKQLPAESVKIDGSFVRDILNDSNDWSLVKAIHDVANSLNKTSVAEFVESAEVYQALKDIGINYAQGYYFGKAMPIEFIIDRYGDDKSVKSISKNIQAIELPFAKNKKMRRSKTTNKKTA